MVRVACDLSRKRRVYIFYKIYALSIMRLFTLTFVSFETPGRLYYYFIHQDETMESGGYRDITPSLLPALSLGSMWVLMSRRAIFFLKSN